MLNKSIFLHILIVALAAFSAVEGSECSGGNFRCSYFSKEECGAEWDAWCTPNDNKVSEFEADCVGTVMCHELSEYQCNLAPKQDQYGGCTYSNSSQMADSVNIALASVSVFLLLVTICLLVKMTRTHAKDAGVATAAETGTATEALLGGSGA